MAGPQYQPIDARTGEPLNPRPPTDGSAEQQPGTGGPLTPTKDITLRDYFAAHAPPMADWFWAKGLLRPKLPEPPAAIADLEMEIVRRGGREGILKAPDDLMDHRRRIEEIDKQLKREKDFHAKQVADYHSADQIWFTEQEARWAFYWADQMMKVRGD